MATGSASCGSWICTLADTADVYIQSDPHEFLQTSDYTLLLAGDASGDGVSDLLISAGQWILNGPF